MKYTMIPMAGLILIGMAGCGNNKNKTEPMQTSHKKDPHSYSEPSKAVITHLELSLSVNFDTRKLSGSATYDIQRSADAQELILDTRDLTISKVSLDDDTAGSAFATEIPDDILGTALIIKLKPETQKVTVFYETDPDAAALQWLQPSQTAGGKKPFLFTQSQAILCRTWIPVQDSPGIRFTYNAKIQVPEGYMAVMSAENPTQRSTDGVYTFTQKKAVPAYLMALAAGDFDYHQYDDRTGVYAEPATLKAAVYEFDETRSMLDAAEALYGPYDWGRYDILVLPPSFPFGGMENPCITFATPSIIAGDKSLNSLVAHELAHSWSGNLVTNRTWDDFWLNEGFTVYFERRIMESIYGKEYADMLGVLGYGDLMETLKDMKEAGQDDDTKLKLNLAGRDPDDGMNDVAYEKGWLFLCQLEREAGREAFDAFLKNWFRDFAFKGADTEEFIEYLQANLIEKSGKKFETDPKKWIYEPGLPEGYVAPTSTRLQKMEDMAAAYMSTGVDAVNLSGLSSHEVQYFLRSLPDDLSTAKMAALDQKFNFTERKNSEEAFLWLRLAVINNYADAYPALDRFLTTIGRRKFVKPLFEAMEKNPATRELAREIYTKARPGYHSVTYNTVDGILKWNP
ncbi:MAG: M1 family metallopeptidase [Flavobacteriales bacterium]|nr:M1 family metallopeptidase [Flavobacteriales bacterium]